MIWVQVACGSHCVKQKCMSYSTYCFPCTDPPPDRHKCICLTKRNFSTLWTSQNLNKLQYNFLFKKQNKKTPQVPQNLALFIYRNKYFIFFFRNKYFKSIISTTFSESKHLFLGVLATWVFVHWTFCSCVLPSFLLGWLSLPCWCVGELVSVKRILNNCSHPGYAVMLAF